MHAKIAAVILLGAGLLLGGCSGANRAIVDQQDMAKVFPWPNNKEKLIIRVKPKTLWVNTCTMLGSFEEVEVTADTTFYIVDELDKKFAYTPSRSPIRRLAPVQSMEIRWPQHRPGEKENVNPPSEGASEVNKAKSTTNDDKGKPTPAVKKKGSNTPTEQPGE